MRKPKQIATTWELRTFDVWGNAKDGYEVNDAWFAGEIELVLDVQVNNPGTPFQFESAYPTDRQIREAFGCGRVRLSLEGDDTHIYVNRDRDGYPIGELYCTSHASLSPIRAVQAA